MQFLTFFNDINPAKPPEERLMSYLDKFGLLDINSQKWNENLQLLVTNYRSFCLNLDPDYQLNEAIQRDIPRSISQLHFFLKEFGFKKSEFPSQERVLQIFKVLSTQIEKFEYYPSYDKFLYVSFTISISFCSKFGLSTEICDSFSFYLSFHLIQGFSLQRIFSNSESGNSFYMTLSLLFAKSEPELAKLYGQKNLAPNFFSMNWILSLFIDLHDIHFSLIILDQILLHSDRRDEFISCLVIAHCKQVPLETNSMNSLSKLNSFRGYKVPKILFDATQILDKTDFTNLERQPVSSNPFDSKMMSWVILIVGLVAGFVIYSFASPKSE